MELAVLASELCVMLKRSQQVLHNLHVVTTAGHTDKVRHKSWHMFTLAKLCYILHNFVLIATYDSMAHVV